jgi:hypothetical protein
MWASRKRNEALFHARPSAFSSAKPASPDSGQDGPPGGELLLNNLLARRFVLGHDRFAGEIIARGAW